MIGAVAGCPDLGADALLNVVGRNIRNKPFFVGLERHRESDRHCDLAQPADRRQQIVLRVVAGGGRTCQSLCCGHEHPVVDTTRADRQRAQADTRKDVGVVGLVDLEPGAVARNRREWATRSASGQQATLCENSSHLDSPSPTSMSRVRDLATPINNAGIAVSLGSC